VAESERLHHLMQPMFTELEGSVEARTHRRLTRLFDRYPARWVWAGFVFVNGFISIGILAFAAYISQTVFIFPSLGPTAFLFFYRPMEPAASPRNAICGHAIGILCGYGALLLFELSNTPASTAFSLERVFCAGLALASTCALMVLLKVIHPPAASTTLVVALGGVTQPFDLLVLELAVIALTIQGIVINRLEGLDYPLWSPLHDL
jgi:CBS domain-containing membrane protein